MKIRQKNLRGICSIFGLLAEKPLMRVKVAQEEAEVQTFLRVYGEKHGSKVCAADYFHLYICCTLYCIFSTVSAGCKFFYFGFLFFTCVIYACTC